LESIWIQFMVLCIDTATDISGVAIIKSDKNKFYERGILLLNKAQKDWIVSYKIMVHFSGDLRAKDPIDEKSEWVEQNAGIYRGVYEQKRDSILLMHIKLLQ